ncbi:hypothetical protein RB195_018523 [Necator americanus]|uniref:Uncharacterized protein n=1 Tax=Necator americanus TaxID=51031 RepID=A0ABR1CB97_NECAM
MDSIAGFMPTPHARTGVFRMGMAIHGKSWNLGGLAIVGARGLRYPKYKIRKSGETNRPENLTVKRGDHHVISDAGNQPTMNENEDDLNSEIDAPLEISSKIVPNIQLTPNFVLGTHSKQVRH